jgi:hypothetical protein
MVIDEVFFGTANCPNAQYVKLRMLSGGQTQVSGKEIGTQNGDGTPAGAFGTFAASVSNGSSGASILIGTADAAALFGISFDAVATGQLRFPDGRICFAESVDCVVYGNFTGNIPGGGSPAPAPMLGLALARMSNGGNDGADFVLAAPAPRNNSGDVGSLGACPGGGDTPTPTATAPVGETPTPESTPTGGPAPACVGDCDGTSDVTVGEIIKGVNIVLGNAALSTCPAIDGSGSGNVRINDLISAVNNLLNGCPATTPSVS